MEVCVECEGVTHSCQRVQVPNKQSSTYPKPAQEKPTNSIDLDLALIDGCFRYMGSPKHAGTFLAVSLI